MDFPEGYPGRVKATRPRRRDRPRAQNKKEAAPGLRARLSETLSNPERLERAECEITTPVEDHRVRAEIPGHRDLARDRADARLRGL